MNAAGSVGNGKVLSSKAQPMSCGELGVCQNSETAESSHFFWGVFFSGFMSLHFLHFLLNQLELAQLRENLR